jgi:hypothetical protein
MEDNVYGVFNHEEKQIIYKQILEPDECKLLNDYLLSIIDNHLDTVNRGNLVTGHRSYVDISLKNDYSFIVEKLCTVLDNYFVNLRVDPNVRLYSQLYGSINPIQIKVTMVYVTIHY